MTEWEKQLRDASFKGVRFFAEGVNEDGQKSMARFIYAEKDYPDVEEMGLSTVFRLRAYFIEENFSDFEPFKAKLEEHGPGELVHPVYGAMRASAVSWSIRFDEREFFAEVDVTFEKVVQKPVVSEMPTLKSQAQALQDKNLEAEAHEQAVLDAGYQGAGIPVSAPVAGLGLPGYLATVAGYTGNVRRELAKVTAFTGQALGFVAPYITPLQVIAADITTIITLPVAVSNQLTAAINSVCGVKASLVNLPGRLSGGISSSFGEMEAAFGSFGGYGHQKAAWKSKKARAMLSAAALELRADEAAEKGETLTLRDYGQSDSEASRSQTMTVDEIDSLVAGARGAVNDALAELKAGYGDGGYALEVNLKAQAALLQEMADDIRLRRPQIIEYQVEEDTSVRLLCFALYQDIRRAPEVLRLNKVKDPNFLKAGERLRVYADGAVGGIKAAPPPEDVPGGNVGPPLPEYGPGVAKTDQARTDVDYTE